MNLPRLLPILILCFLYAISFGSRPAFAESLSLKVSPPLLKIDAVQPADTQAPFTIENQGNETITLTISYKFFKPEGENGQIAYIAQPDQTDKILLKKVQIVDKDGFAIDSFRLDPKEKKQLKLRILIDQNDPTDNYYFSAIFSTKPEQTTSDMQLARQDKTNTSFIGTGIAMNVLLTVGPQLPPQTYIEEFSTPFYRKSGPVPFTVRIQNKGNQVISPKGVILITNMFGQTIGKVELPKTNILSGDIRALSNSNAALYNSTSEMDKPKQAVWPEKFLLGFYTAKLSLVISDEGPIYNKSIPFIAFPVNFVVGIIVGIILLLTIYFRLKKRLKDE